MLTRLIPIHQEMADGVFKQLKRLVFGAVVISALFTTVAPTQANAQATVHGARKTATVPLSPDAIFKKYKDAVVRIEVSLHGASLGVGAGYFTASNGEITTSLHVVRPLLVHPESDVKIKTSKGAIFRNVKIGACSDSRGVDLCLLKVEHTPSAILPPLDVEVTPGESIVAIGHPRGLDFSVSTGIVSAVREHPSGWREVQIDAAISPGNSGGPIINRFGQGIGVVYQFERDGQNLNFGILAPEIRGLKTQTLPFQSLAEARKTFADRSKRLAKRTFEKWMRPAIASLGDPKQRPTGFKWMRAQLGSSTFQMLLPDIFQNCERVDESDEASATTCATGGGDLILSIQKRPRSLEGPLHAYRGRRLVESRPLALVERLEAEGQWENLKTRTASFMSRPSPARCHSIQKKQVVSSDESMNIAVRKKGFFQDATSVCRFETENDSEPGSLSVSQWIESGSDFFGINVWVADPGRLLFAQGLSDLVFTSAGTSQDGDSLPYRLKLRPGLSKSPAPNRARQISGTDIYDVFQDDTSSVTVARTGKTQPSQMNKMVGEWAASIAKSNGMKLASNSANGTTQMSFTEVAGSNGRIANWVMNHPTDKSKSALLMLAAGFGDQETWVIFEIQNLAGASSAVRRTIAGSASMTTNMTNASDIPVNVDRFRGWVQEFEPIKSDSQD